MIDRYGYVTPDDVPALLDQHIGKGEIIEHLWRFVLLWFCLSFFEILLSILDHKSI